MVGTTNGRSSRILGRGMAVLAALAWVCSALAADVGGIPANPNFQSVNLNGSHNVIIAGKATDWEQIRLNDSSFAHVGAICFNVTAGQCLSGDRQGDLEIYTPIGGGVVRNNASFYSFAEVNTNTGTCSISSAYASSNISGCTWVATGKYTISFTVGSVKDAVCTATIQNNGSPLANEIVELSGGTTTVGAQVYIAGSLGDGADFNLICYGS